MTDDLLARADAHMAKFPSHDLVAKLAERVRELEKEPDYITPMMAGALKAGNLSRRMSFHDYKCLADAIIAARKPL